MMKPLLTLVSVLLIGANLLASNVSGATKTDPQPIQIATVPSPSGKPLRVLRTAKGEPLRGPTLWQWKSCPENNRAGQRNGLLEDRPLFAEFREAGMTAVRLASFEVWFQSDRQPYAPWSWSDLSNPTEKQRLLKVIETAVNAAASQGLYLILNAHNKFNAYDHDYTTAFWKLVAPYFANRAHVLFELVNEIRTGPADYSDEDLRKHVALSRRVRELAPTTFQIILTPSGTWAPSTPDGTGLDPLAMRKLAERFDRECQHQGASCDWQRTAVGYHLYFNGKTSVILTNLHEHYPGLPTEVSFPYGVKLTGVKDNDTARSESMDGKRFVNHVCETLGLGWLQWHTETPEKWRHHLTLLTQDAKRQGYFWTATPPPVIQKVEQP